MQEKIKTSLYSKFVNALCKKFIKKNSVVFDCGCGDGFHTSIIKKYASSVIGGDFDNRTKREYEINFRKIVPNDYGKENEFDIVTAFDVIEHVKDDKRFVSELVKILNPGGILILGTPNRMRLSNFLISIFRGKITYPRNLGYCFESGGDIIHLREYTEADLRKLFGKFDNIEIKAVYRSFLGLYTPWGSFGYKNIDAGRLGNYSQHLFFCVKKI